MYVFIVAEASNDEPSIEKQSIGDRSTSRRLALTSVACQLSCQLIVRFRKLKAGFGIFCPCNLCIVFFILQDRVDGEVWVDMVI